MATRAGEECGADPLPPLVRVLRDQVAQSACDLPCVVMFAADPRALEVAVDALLTARSGGRPVRGADLGAAVPVHAPCGAMILRVPTPRPSTSSAFMPIAAQASQSAAHDDLVACAKARASQRRVDMRRGMIVVHGVGHLLRHAQHALRKIVESTTASTLFVLTTHRSNCIDPPLLSRSVLVNCNRCRPLAPAPPPTAAGGGGGMNAFLAAAKLSARRRRGLAGHHEALLVSARASAPGISACISAWLDELLGHVHDDNGNERCHGAVAAAADADWLASAMRQRGVPEGAVRELAARAFLAGAIDAVA